MVYSTIDEARHDLYVMTDVQFDHVRKRPFPPVAESSLERVKHLLAFIKQSQGLKDPPHIRVEQPGTRTDIALESIGISLDPPFLSCGGAFFLWAGKRMGPNVLHLWNGLLDLASPSHFRMDCGDFVPIPNADLEHYQPLVEAKAAPEQARGYSRLPFQPMFERQAGFGAFGGRHSDRYMDRHSDPYAQQHSFNTGSYPFDDPMVYNAGPARPNTVQVSEVGPAPTPYEKFITLESDEKVAALRRFYSHGTLIPLNQKEFNAVLRKFNAHALKRSREQEEEEAEERPVTRAQKAAKSSSKKSRKPKKQKKGEGDVVVEEEEA
jgi:hypothetical protein